MTHAHSAGLLAVVILGCLAAATTQTQTREWTFSPDEEGNLRADCSDPNDVTSSSRSSNGGGSCAGFVSVPQLRVTPAHGGTPSQPAPHLDIRYDAAASEFLVETSPAAVDLQIGGTRIADRAARIATLSAENAALRNTQARIQCALSASGTANVGDAIPIATDGGRDMEYFSIGGEHYLVVANYHFVDGQTQDTVVYRYAGDTFVHHQTVPMVDAGPRDLEVFTIGSEQFLAVAKFPGNAYEANSTLYRWAGDGFVLHQSITTIRAVDMEFFTIGTEHFLAVANLRNSESFNQESHVYVWSDSEFEFVFNQSIATTAARDIEHFVMFDDQHFLVVANHMNYTSPRVDTVVYKWDSGKFVFFEAIATTAANAVKHFVIADDQHYLVIANFREGDSYAINSTVYWWDGQAFAVYQDIPTIGAKNWEPFTIDGEHYLALANLYDFGSYFQDSLVLKWSGPPDFNFVIFQRVPTVGAILWRHFQMGQQHYLGVANFYNGTSHNQTSFVYRWNSRCFV